MASRLRGTRGQNGAVAVEFAIVFTFVLAPLLFGTLQYGFYFWEKSSANAAVREGARRASVGDYASCADFTAFVKAQGGQAVTSGASTKIKRSFKTIAGATASPPKAGDIMTVTLEFKAIDVGFPLPNGGLIQSDMTSRVENVKTPLESCP